jgi:hypothetical protein
VLYRALLQDNKQNLAGNGAAKTEGTRSWVSYFESKQASSGVLSDSNALTVPLVL